MSDQPYDGPFSPKENVVVLLYHMIAEEDPPSSSSGMSTSAARFEENLETLMDAGYLPLSLEDF